MFVLSTKLFKRFNPLARKTSLSINTANVVSLSTLFFLSVFYVGGKGVTTVRRGKVSENQLTLNLRP